MKIGGLCQLKILHKCREWVPSNGGIDTDLGESKHAEKNLPQWHFSTMIPLRLDWDRTLVLREEGTTFSCPNHRYNVVLYKTNQWSISYVA